MENLLNYGHLSAPTPRSRVLCGEKKIAPSTAWNAPQTPKSEPLTKVKGP